MGGVKTLFVTNRYSWRSGQLFVSAVENSGPVTKLEVEDAHEPPRSKGYEHELPLLSEYDAVVFFVKFKQLRLWHGINWGHYDGLKVLWDDDSFMDYAGWANTPYRGEWTEHFRRLNFDLLVVCGERSRAHFAAEGFDVALLHQGYAAQEFMNLDVPRAGVGHYGNPYPARLAMLRRVRAAGIAIDHFHAPFAELNAALNRLSAVVVCNMTATMPFGRIGRSVEARLPGVGLRLCAAPGPMKKNFESAAAGCAVFMDWTPDLESLGFLDGKTAIIYQDMDELVEKLDYWLAQPERLREVGLAAAKLCLARHTYEHRAARLQEILRERIAHEASRPRPIK